MGKVKHTINWVSNIFWKPWVVILNFTIKPQLYKPIIRLNKVAIYGGLGNQMFQYSLCMALNKKGKKTRIAISNFLHENYHNGFDLGRAFNLKLPFPDNLFNYFLLNFGSLYKNKIAIRFINRFIRNKLNKKYSIYRERTEFHHDPEIFKQDSCLLIGIWQVETYFADIKSLIQKEFQFKIPRGKKNQLLIEEITNCNSVSIHIRRGDYFNDHWKGVLGIIQDDSYYIKAINLIETSVENPKYFIFSDDLKWAKENLNLPGSIYIDHNRGKNSYIDMYLMSLCKHNIIANSTFSWWAAWLNKNSNKIVIMPDQWLQDTDTPGIFPAEWIRMGMN